MAYIRTSRSVARGLSGPRWPFGVDTDAPLGDVRAAWIVDVGKDTVQTLRAIGPWAAPADNSTASGSIGFSERGAHVDGIASWVATGPTTPASAWTIAGLCKLPAANKWVVSFGDQAASKGPHIGRHSTGVWRVGVWGSASVDWTISGISAGDWMWFAGTFQGSTQRNYVNGLLRMASSSASYLQPTANTYWIGDILGLNNRAEVPIRWVGVWDRALSAGEVAYLHDESTQFKFVHELGRRTYFISAAAAGGATVPIFHHHYQQMRTA